MASNIEGIAPSEMNMALLVVSGIWANSLAREFVDPEQEMDNRIYLFDSIYKKLMNYAYSEEKPKKVL